jgi:hypothetical protein
MSEDIVKPEVVNIALDNRPTDSDRSQSKTLETIKETVEEPVKEGVDASASADLLIKKVAETIKQSLGDSHPGFQLLIKIAMEVVEKTDVKGVSQKDLAVNAIRMVAQSVQMDISVLALIDTEVLGDAIELVVSATKGEINVNKVVATGIKACFLACFGKKK